MFCVCFDPKWRRRHPDAPVVAAPVAAGRQWEEDRACRHSLGTMAPVDETKKKKSSYVPTGKPRGRKKGQKKGMKGWDGVGPMKPKGKYVPTGKPRGRPKKQD